MDQACRESLQTQCYHRLRIVTNTFIYYAAFKVNSKVKSTYSTITFQLLIIIKIISPTMHFLTAYPTVVVEGLDPITSGQVASP